MSDSSSPLAPSRRGPRPEPTTPPVVRWPMLVVSEVDDVVLAVGRGVAGAEIEGRPVEVQRAHTADAALAAAAAEPALAVALIDAELQPEGTGMSLVQRLRGDLARRALRIVLYSAGDDSPALLDLIRHHDIDDWWCEADLAPARVLVGLTTALRAYAQLAEIERQHLAWQALRDQLQRSRNAQREASDERLRAEQALQQAHQTLEACIEQRTRALSAAIDELDAFNRRVAQDLRTPLHGITGLSGLIQQGLDSGDLDQVRRWASMLEHQSRRLAEHVADLLNLSQPAPGEPGPSALPLSRLAEEARDTLRVGERAGAAAAIRVAPDLPVLAVDAQLMRQAFVNLFDNALKFTRDRPQPTIAVDAARDGDEWVIRVTDDGCGFPAEAAPLLFEPFSRLHDADGPGAGIGLTVVRRIVEHHGGRIWAEGEPGRGARICFTLPADGPPRT